MLVPPIDGRVKERILEKQDEYGCEGMNNSLIAIGIRNSRMIEKALTIADKIGKVEIYYGKTNCKTPYAPEFIERTVARKKSRGQRYSE